MYFYKYKKYINSLNKPILSLFKPLYKLINIFTFQIKKGLKLAPLFTHLFDIYIKVKHTFLYLT